MQTDQDTWNYPAVWFIAYYNQMSWDFKWNLISKAVCMNSYWIQTFVASIILCEWLFSSSCNPTIIFAYLWKTCLISITIVVAILLCNFIGCISPLVFLLTHLNCGNSYSFCKACWENFYWFELEWIVTAAHQILLNSCVSHTLDIGMNKLNQSMKKQSGTVISE